MHRGAWWAIVRRVAKSRTFSYFCVSLCVKYVFVYCLLLLGFPDSSVGKESAFNAGDLGLNQEDLL